MVSEWVRTAQAEVLGGHWVGAGPLWQAEGREVRPTLRLSLHSQGLDTALTVDIFRAPPARLARSFQVPSTC